MKQKNWNTFFLEAGGYEDDFTTIPAINYYLRNFPKNWGYFTKIQNNSCLGMFKYERIVHIGR